MGHLLSGRLLQAVTHTSWGACELMGAASPAARSNMRPHEVRAEHGCTPDGAGGDCNPHMLVEFLCAFLCTCVLELPGTS